MADTEVLSEHDANDPAKAVQLDPIHAQRIEKCEVLADGVDAIRDGREKYLPRMPGESEERYGVRVMLGAPHLAYEQMLAMTIGYILQNDIVFDENAPEKMRKFIESVNGSNQHITLYLQDLLRTGLVQGFAGTFTDMQSLATAVKNAEGTSAAVDSLDELDAEDGDKLGMMPYFILVRPGDYRAYYRTISGKRTLVMFILRQKVKKQVGLFGETHVTQYRIYRRSKGGQITRELYEQKLDNQRAEKVPNSLTTITGAKEICWSPLPCGPITRKGYHRPTLEPVADLVYLYYQVQNGLLSLEFECFVATLVREGAKPIPRLNADGTPQLDEEGHPIEDYPPLFTGLGEVIEQPARMAHDGTSGGSIYYLQPDPEVIEPAEASLNRIERMLKVAIGAFFDNDVSGESGEAKKQKSRGPNATISKVARATKDSIELSLGHAADFMGVDRALVGAVMNTTFDELKMTANDINAIGNLVDKEFPLEEAVEMLMLGKVLPPRVNIKELAARWEDRRAAGKEAARIEDELNRDAQDTGDEPPPEDSAE